MTIYILLILAAVGTGMAISVYAFGTGGKRKRIFQDIYFSVEDNEGVGVVYTKNGEYAAILRMENPVDKYSADIDGYYEYTRLHRHCPNTRRRVCAAQAGHIRAQTVL